MPATLAASAKEAVNKLQWFLAWKAPWIESTSIKPATQAETGEIYGAIMRGSPSVNSTQRLEIIFSNNASEPIPYLIPLIVHEIQHAVTFREKMLIEDR